MRANALFVKIAFFKDEKIILIADLLEFLNTVTQGQMNQMIS